MARCYVKHDNDIVDVTGVGAYNNLPCSNATGVQTCCANNSECTKDGFCYFTHQLDAAVTGYYLGGCTDPNFEDPACPQHCTGLPTQDVVYNTQSGLWACCYGSGELDCNDPSDETFYAPGPQAILATSSAVPTSTSASTSSQTHTSSGGLTFPHTTSSAYPTASSAGSSSRANGDSDNTTTIVVATVIPVVFIIAVVGVFFWFLKRKSRQHRQAQQRQDHGFGSAQSPSSGSGWYSGRQEAAYYKAQPKTQSRIHELPADQHRAELNATSRRSELKSN